MPSQFEQRLDRLYQQDALETLRQTHRGIEKESLRINPQGKLAQTPHPSALGSPLCNSYLTTDFSEALLELITPVFEQPEQVLGFVAELHRYVYQHLDSELLWPASMPPIIPADNEIPVARYGSANVAKMKTAYRVGLGHRYGRSMQTIAGIHYNYSIADTMWPLLRTLDYDNRADKDYITDNYFKLIRNFRRLSWLLIYLFGASPAVCKSFVADKPHQLETFDNKTFYLPYATSLRMGGLGYQSNAQNSLMICYNQLQTYIDTLLDAITQPHSDYESIPMVKDGQYQQLSTSLLQIENEFYSAIRPKRVTESGETPLHALQQRGVEYIEVRCIDLNPYLANGIDAQQIRFLDTFLLYCLLQPSRLCDDADTKRINQNLSLVVNRGREPGLMLQRSTGSCSLQDWAEELFSGISQVADLLDKAYQSEEYSAACSAMYQRIQQPELTPSAQLLADMQTNNQSYIDLIMSLSHQHAEYFRQSSAESSQQQLFEQEAAQSLLQQQQIEQQDNIDFSHYLQNYFQQYQQLR